MTNLWNPTGETEEITYNMFGKARETITALSRFEAVRPKDGANVSP